MTQPRIPIKKEFNFWLATQVPKLHLTRPDLFEELVASGWQTGSRPIRDWRALCRVLDRKIAANRAANYPKK